MQKFIGQTKFEKLLWDVSPNMPNTAFRAFVNAIEHNKHYYVFGFNDGYSPTLTGCNNPYDGWIVFKCDSAGNLIKAVRIGGPKAGERMYFPAIRTRDGGFLIPGESASFSVKGTCDSGNANANFIKLDSNLNVQWLKSVGGKKWDVAGPVKQMKNGKYMAFGMSDSYGHGAPYPIGYADPDIYMMKLDTNGNLLWSMTYGTKASDILFAVEQDEDDNFYVAGLSLIDSGVGIPHPFVFKMDSNGIIKWANFYYNNISNYYNAFLDVKLNNNYLYLIHDHQNNNFKFENKLIKININSGNIIQQMGFTTIENYESSVKMLMIKNNLIIKFWILSSPPHIRGKVKLNTNILNFIEYGYYISSLYEILAGGGAYKNTKDNIFLTSDSSLITGTNIMLNPSNFTNSRILLFKMDNEANTCEPDTGQILQDTMTITYTPVTGSITSINQGTVLSWTPTIYVGGKDSSICFCPDIPLSIQKTPVNCYSNGSATINPIKAGNYSYFWSPPVSTTNTASNLSAGIYTVQIMDSSGCKKTAVITITTNFNLPLSISGQTQICSGQIDTLILHGAQALTWNTGQTDSIIFVQPNVTTTYSAVVVNGSCQDSVYFTVNVLPTPVLSVTPTSYTLNIGDTAFVQASGATYYSWSPSFGVCSPSTGTTLITPTATTEYCIFGKDTSQKCIDTACVKLVVDGTCFDIRVPNIFTPNSDNTNDAWKPDFPCPQIMTNYELMIYDRWGVKLFETIQPNAAWDGRTISGEPVPTGTYIYTISFKLNNKKQKLKGYITLMK